MTVALLADENFDGDILKGLRQRVPDLDVVRVQDVGLTEATDPVVLEWAAREGRVLLTHDVKTMPAHAYQRVQAGLTMVGVIETPRSLPVGRAVEAIALLVQYDEPTDFANRVLFLPRR